MLDLVIFTVPRLADQFDRGGAGSHDIRHQLPGIKYSFCVTNHSRHARSALNSESESCRRSISFVETLPAVARTNQELVNGATPQLSRSPTAAVSSTCVLLFVTELEWLRGTSLTVAL